MASSYIGTIIVLVILAFALYIIESAVALPAPLGTILYYTVIIIVFIIIVLIILLALDYAGIYSRGLTT
jgi:hypothetical protein